MIAKRYDRLCRWTTLVHSLRRLSTPPAVELHNVASLTRSVPANISRRDWSNASKVVRSRVNGCGGTVRSIFWRASTSSLARASPKRSARQTEDARFWLMVDGRGYYPIIRTVAEAKKLSLIDSARLFALAAVAREDALIAVFDAKYHYEFWRSVTAIRNGDIDNNSATERDPAY
jgi:hypothetical protein